MQWLRWRQGLQLLEGIGLFSYFDTSVQILLTLDKSSLAVMQWLRWRQGVRLRGIALGLSVAGQAKLAERLISGWRVCASFE